MFVWQKLKSEQSKHQHEMESLYAYQEVKE